jgi:hypothetical protein
MTPEEIKKKFELIDAQFRGLADAVYLLLEVVGPCMPAFLDVSWQQPMECLKKSMADIGKLRAELKASESKEART